MPVSKRFSYFAVLLLFLAFSFLSVATGSELSTNLYPLPMTELKAVISDWLLASGFEVMSSAPQRGQVDINAIKGQDVWQLSLIAHSPLATKVMAQKTENGNQDQLLWNHIIQYVRGLSSDAQQENRRTKIPSSVLSRVESVVCIKTTEGEKTIQFSGFAISGQGAIICTAHDLNDHSRVTVALNDGREVEGRVVKLDALRDLAIVLVEAHLKAFVDLRNGHNHLDENERLFSVGCPMNVFGVIQSGTLSGAPRRLDGLPLWQVNMVMHPGSSGSPVFDAAGNLVAIIKGRYRGTDSLGLLIPFETLLAFAKEN